MARHKGNAPKEKTVDGTSKIFKKKDLETSLPTARSGSGRARGEPGGAGRVSPGSAQVTEAAVVARANASAAAAQATAAASKAAAESQAQADAARHAAAAKAAAAAAAPINSSGTTGSATTAAGAGATDAHVGVESVVFKSGWCFTFSMGWRSKSRA